MARTNHSLVLLLRNAMFGAIAGAGLILLAGALLIVFAPQRHDAAVILFHLPGSGMSDSARDFVAAALAQPDFLTSVVTKHGWDNAKAKHLADNLSVEATNAAGSVAELHLRGSDPATLTSTLETVVEEMVALQSGKHKEIFQPLLNELSTELKTAEERRQKFRAPRRDFGSLPPSARSTIVVATDLAGKRLELELDKRYQLRPGSASQDMKRQRRLNALIAIQKERQQKPVNNLDFESAHFKRESELAYSDVEIKALKQTKRRLDSELEHRKPLIVGRKVAVTPLATDYKPLVLLAVVGGLIGGLIGGLVWSYHQSSTGYLTASVIENYLNIPVAGVTAQVLTDYGEGERQLLVASDSRGLAIAGIRSVRVALQLLAQANPVVFSEIGDRQHASHIIANLAVVAAQAGERVLIVDVDNGQSVLADLFASNNKTHRAIAADVDETSKETELVNATSPSRIRFIGRDNTGKAADVKTQPVAPEVMADFERIFIYAGAPDTAKRVLNGYPSSVGIVVCASNVRLSVLRKARVKNMHAVLLGGHPIDVQAYRDGPTAS
ncbi:MAG: hypothetical protein ACI915_000513 [Gammaproteobacteria bacterium]